MKSYRECEIIPKKKSPFEPIFLKLETQEEVDAAYVVFNHTCINGVLLALRGTYKTLTEHKSDMASAYLSNLSQAMRDYK